MTKVVLTPSHVQPGDPHRLLVDGSEVPYITVYESNGKCNLVLDGRFGFQCSRVELEQWAWFLANAMAVSGGYTWHGEGSQPRNPHGPSYFFPPPQVQEMLDG